MTIPANYADQPIVELERDGVRYTLLGTAHVSKASIDAVMAAIDSGRFDAVAVELDEQRHKALTNPEVKKKIDDQGGEPYNESAESFAAFIQKETDKWAKVVKSSGASLD